MAERATITVGELRKALEGFHPCLRVYVDVGHANLDTIRAAAAGPVYMYEGPSWEGADHDSEFAVLTWPDGPEEPNVAAVILWHPSDQDAKPWWEGGDDG